MPVESRGAVLKPGVEESAEQTGRLAKRSDRRLKCLDEGVQREPRIHLPGKALPISRELAFRLSETKAMEEKADGVVRDSRMEPEPDVVLTVLKPDEKEVGALDLTLAQRLAL
jgi:hypothetical protein